MVLLKFWPLSKLALNLFVSYNHVNPTNLLSILLLILLILYVLPMYCIYPIITINSFGEGKGELSIYLFYYNHLFTHFTTIILLVFIFTFYVSPYHLSYSFIFILLQLYIYPFYYNNFACFHIDPPCIALPFIRLSYFNYILNFLLLQ